MGIYVNPVGVSKEVWLVEHGTRVEGGAVTSLAEAPAGTLPVCLADNGWMTAAGVAFDDRELEAWNDPGDPRPKVFFYVPVKDLLTVVAPADVEVLAPFLLDAES